MADIISEKPKRQRIGTQKTFTFWGWTLSPVEPESQRLTREEYLEQTYRPPTAWEAEVFGGLR